MTNPQTTYPTGVICKKCDRTIVVESRSKKWIQAEGNPDCRFPMEELSRDVAEFLLEGREHGW